MFVLNKKGQISIEFMMVIAGLVLIFALCIFASNVLRSSVFDTQKNYDVEYIAKHLGQTINNVYSSGNGFSQTITLKTAEPYLVSYYKNRIYVAVDDSNGNYSYFLSTNNIDLNAVKYLDVIVSNVSGTVVVNDVP